MEKVKNVFLIYGKLIVKYQEKLVNNLAKQLYLSMRLMQLLSKGIHKCMKPVDVYYLLYWEKLIVLSQQQMFYWYVQLIGPKI